MATREWPMRLMFYIVVAVSMALAGAATFFYVALPTEFVRDELVAQVLSRTGRSLTVAGPISISVYPSAAVELDDVRLSPPPGMAGDAAVSIRSLTLKLPLWQLLRRELQVERVDLDHPVIVLRTDADGRRNWDLRKDASDQPRLRSGKTDDKGAPAANPAAAVAINKPAPVRVAALQGLGFRDVHITSGTIRAIDDRSGFNEVLSDVSLNLALDEIEGPVRFDGTVIWSGEPTNVKGTLGSASSVLTGDPVALDMTLAGRLATTSIKGTFSQLEPSPLNGHLELSAPSLRDLMGWLKHPLPAGPGFGALTLAADFGLSTDGFTARNANLALDGGKMTGGLSLMHGPDRPMLRAELAIDHLDLNSYLADEQAPAATAPKDQNSPAINKAPTVNDAGWSGAPINLSALRLADADIALTLGALQWRSLKSGRTLLKVAVKDGVMKDRLSDMELYGGKGSGTVTIDARTPDNRLEANFALHNIQAQPFLSDAVGLTRLAGRGDVIFNFMGSGHNQSEIVKGLMGQGRLDLADGAYVGVNLAAGAKALQNGQFGGWDSQPSAKTDFSTLTASCTITDGLVENRDLVLTAPLIRLTGTGTASLPERRLDYGLRATFIDSAQGQAATDAGVADAGLTLPVHVTGPWAKPAVSVDVKAIAKNPQAALETVKKAVGKFAETKQGKALGDLIGGLLGKAQKQTDPATDQPPQQ